MNKSCLNCEHGEEHYGEIFRAYCDLDIGELIKDPEKAAKECKFYRYDRESEGE